MALKEKMHQDYMLESARHLANWFLNFRGKEGTWSDSFFDSESGELTQVSLRHFKNTQEARRSGIQDARSGGNEVAADGREVTWSPFRIEEHHILHMKSYKDDGSPLKVMHGENTLYSVTEDQIILPSTQVMDQLVSAFNVAHLRAQMIEGLREERGELRAIKDTEIKELKGQVDALRKQAISDQDAIDTLRAARTKQSDEIRDLKTDLKQVRRARDDIALSRDKLAGNLAQAGVDISGLKAEISELKGGLDARDSAISELRLKNGLLTGRENEAQADVRSKMLEVDAGKAKIKELQASLQSHKEIIDGLNKHATNLERRVMKAEEDGAGKRVKELEMLRELDGVTIKSLRSTNETHELKLAEMSGAITQLLVLVQEEANKADRESYLAYLHNNAIREAVKSALETTELAPAIRRLGGAVVAPETHPAAPEASGEPQMMHQALPDEEYKLAT